MKIRTRIIISLVVAGLFIPVTYYIFFNLQQKRNELLEDSYRKQLLQSMNMSMAVNRRNMKNLVFDYTHWDGMKRFAETWDSAWGASNLSTFLSTHGYNGLWIFNSNRENGYKDCQSGTYDFPWMLDSFFFQLIADSGFIHFFEYQDGQLFECAASPIHSTEYTGGNEPHSGFFILARKIDSGKLRELQELSSSFVTVRERLQPSAGEESLTRISASLPLYAWDGKNLGALLFTRHQPSLNSYLNIARTTEIFYLIFSFLMLLFFMFILFRWVTIPLKKITESLALEEIQPITGLSGKRHEFGIIASMIERFFAQKRELAAIVREKSELLADLAISETSMRTILNAIPDKLVRINREGKILQSHLHPDPYDGFDPVLKPKANVFDLFPHRYQHLVRKATEEAAKNKNLQMVAFNTDQETSRIRYYEASFSPVAESDILVTIRDITQRKETELTLHRLLEKEAELNRLKTHFLTTISHEFRTPLSAIQSNIQLLDMYDGMWDHEKKQTSFGRIIQSIQHMTALLEDVAVIGRHDAGKMLFNPSIFNLKELIGDLVASARNLVENPAEVAVSYTLHQALVLMDKHLVQHILTNLLTNAIKFTASGKCVSLIVKPASDDQVIFAIIDQGIGITPADLPNLFEPFFRGKNSAAYHGTGLGLTIVKRCVETHHGTIRIESTEGEGTSIHISLPNLLNQNIQL
jgi:signal transduction histidine kinase